MRTSNSHHTGELRTEPKHKSEHGFTLIEIVLVLAIIAMLLGAGVFHLIGVGRKGAEVRAKSDFKTLRTALNLYQMDAGTYPSTEQGLAALVTKPKVGRIPKSYRAYLDEEIQDPWGNPYVYAWPSSKGGELPEIYTLGKDGLDNTGDEIHMRARRGED